MRKFSFMHFGDSNVARTLKTIRDVHDIWSQLIHSNILNAKSFEYYDVIWWNNSTILRVYECEKSFRFRLRYFTDIGFHCSCRNLLCIWNITCCWKHNLPFSYFANLQLIFCNMQYKKVENLVIYKGEQDYTYSTLLNLLILLKNTEKNP